MKSKIRFKSILVKIFLLGILLNVAVADAQTKSSSIDRVDIWLKFSQSEHIRVFDAIVLNGDTRYIPDLKEFLDQLESKNFQNAQAIYTLAQLGDPDAAERFEKLLMCDFDAHKYDGKLWIRQKISSLEYMDELGMKPSDAVIDRLFSQILAGGNPEIIDLAATLLIYIDELPEEVETYLHRLITNGWRRLNRDSVKALNIQPDWENLFKHTSEKYRTTLLRFLLDVGDEASKKEYLERANLTFHPHSSRDDTNQWIAASIGDENVIKLMSETIPGMQSYYIEQNPVVFSDATLLKRLDYKLTGFESVQVELLYELLNRGYKSEVENYINTMNRFLTDFYTLGYCGKSATATIKKECRSMLKIAKNDYPAAMLGKCESEDEEYWSLARKKNRVKSMFRDYDPMLILDICESKFSKSDSLSNSKALIYAIEGAWDHSNLATVHKWVIDNQEIVIKAIQIQFKNPTKKVRKQYFRYFHLWEDQMDLEIYRAFNVMLLLPEDVINRNFSRIDEKCMSSHAVATGTYFNKDWPYEYYLERY